MENQYTCRFDIDRKGREVEIHVHGEDQDICFTFLIPFFSIPSFFYLLLQLWNNKSNKTMIDGFGFAVEYHFKREERNVLIDHLIDYKDGEPIFIPYTFDFERFVKAVDQGFSDYLLKQRNEGLFPLAVEEHTHPLSAQVIKEYQEFSAIINKLEPDSN